MGYYDPRESQKLDDLVRSSFSDNVDRNRRFLLTLSVISLFVSITGLTPSDVSVIGVKLPQSSHGWLLVFLGTVLLYQLIRFWILALPETNKAAELRKAHERDRMGITSNRRGTQFWLLRRALRASGRYQLWRIVEYRLPLILGFVSLAGLVWRLWKLRIA